MISLAPYLFRNVFSQQGGPIARVTACEFAVFGRKQYQATAFLAPELANEKPSVVMFGTCDGTGVAENPVVARHKAISEALERWAFFEVRRSGNLAPYAFDVDRTSNGMAAFPGFSWQARRRARFEALERFAVVGWWDRQFAHSLCRSPYPNVSAVRIHHGQSFGEVTIVYRRAPAGFTSYGYGAGATLDAAIRSAASELVRAEFVISRHRARGGMVPVTDHMERRCLHYSTQEGHAEFQDRLAADPAKKAATWRTLFDGEIRGRWSQWATVWRHAVDMPSYDFLEREKLFFFW